MANVDLAYFEGFSWAVPTGFRTALASCRFDEGDIIHDSRDAYDMPWRETVDSEFHHSLQVQAIVSSRSSARGDTQRAFRTSWTEGIRVALTDHWERKTRLINTTQGRLYSVFWKGDPSLLDRAVKPPNPPKMVGELQPELAVAARAIRERHFSKLSDGCAVLFAIDHASTAQVLKARTVESALRPLGNVESCTFTPGEAGVGNDFCPTILLHCYAVATTKRKPIVAALKARLYRPARDRKADVDRFSLERHGWLFDLGP